LRADVAWGQGHSSDRLGFHDPQFGSRSIANWER
jgi:hypothetical protein